MTDVRIICAHDAAKLGETLMRLLEAEEHSAHLTIGRQAMQELDDARAARDAVILIWSQDARSQSYMLDWLRNIEAARIVELDLTGDPPKYPRKATALDFSTWRGARGTSQWNALNDRLRGVARALNPPKPPPKYAALALGVASAAAVAGAVVLRVHEHALPLFEDNTNQEALIAGDPSTGLGGPLSAIEPASIDDDLNFRRMQNLAPLPPRARASLAELDVQAEVQLRDETLLEMLNSLNPLRQQSSES